MYLESTCAYRGAIPFYGRHDDLPPHGYIIPRDDLDYTLLQHAEKAGAVIRDGCAVKSVSRSEAGVEITMLISGATMNSSVNEASSVTPR